jgi:HlyD family secretion protein
MTTQPTPAAAPTTAPAVTKPKASDPVTPGPKAKSNVKRNLILGGVGLAVAGALVWAFIPKAMSVEVATVTEGRFERAVQEYGKMRVRDRYTVSAPLAGRVGRVVLRQGDTVLQGDTVALVWPMAPALLDARTQAELAARIGAAGATLARARANVGSAQAAMQQAQVELGRSEALARQGFISPNQNESGRLTLKLRLTELESARQTEAAAQYDLEQARAARQRFLPERNEPAPQMQGSVAVKAPVSGKVLKVLQQSEASVMPGAGLVELGDPTKLEVVVDILTEDATEVAPGAAVELLNWGGPQAIAGKVRWVEPAAFTKVSALGVEEQRVNVIIDITGPAVQRKALGDGFKVDVRILVQVVEGAVMVPVSALFPMGSRSGVFVLEEDHVRLQEVSARARNGVSAWVEDGLAVGAKVVVYPDSKLKDKASVKVR